MMLEFALPRAASRDSYLFHLHDGVIDWALLIDGVLEDVVRRCLRPNCRPFP